VPIRRVIFVLVYHAVSSRGFITQRCRPVAQQPPASPGNAVNQA